MPTTDHDLELIESYLDESLDLHEVEPLRARLTSDPDLLAALNQLRDERALRRSLFTALEPDPAALDAFAARLHRATTTAPARPAPWARPLRYAAAAAAFVAIGFVARGLFDRPQATHSGTDVTQVTQQNKGVDLQKVDAYQVTLRDETGRVVAVQRFDSLDKAQEFAADLSRWQARNQRLAAGRFVVTADRF